MTEYKRSFVIANIVFVAMACVVTFVLLRDHAICTSPHLFQVGKLNVGAVTAITIGPEGHTLDQSLVESAVTVTSIPTIQQIAQAANNAQSFFPNHPSGRWYARLDFHLADGSMQSVTVVHTEDDNGTFLNVNTNVSDGWHVGDYRCDELAKILKTAVK